MASGYKCAIVAANDSSLEWKNKAGYICDGVDDQVEIQTAINTGGLTQLSAGTFNIAASISMGETNGALRGQGNSTILRAVNNFNSTIIKIEAGQVIVGDLAIDGNRANQTSGVGLSASVIAARYSKVRNLWVKECKDYGIVLGDPNEILDIMDVNLEDVWVQACTIGVLLTRFGGWWLKNVYITDSTTYAVKIKRATWVEIVGGRYTGGSGVNCSGVYVTQSSAILITAVDIDGMGNHGIVLSGDSGTVSGIVITSSQIRENSYISPGTYSNIYIKTDIGTIEKVTIVGNDLTNDQEKASVEVTDMTSKLKELDMYGNLFGPGRMKSLPDTLIAHMIEKILRNSNMESGTAGWVDATQLATVTSESSIVKVGTKSLKIVANDPGGTGFSWTAQNIPATPYRGMQVTFGFWVYALSTNDKPQRVGVYDDTYETVSGEIAKDNSWHWVTFTHTVSPTATNLRLTAFAKVSNAADTDDTLYIDGVTMATGYGVSPSVVMTENSGTATIAAGQTSVNVTHNLAATPTRVQLTPTTDTAGKRYWVSAKGASTFTITIDTTYTSDITFDWRAVVGEGN